MSRQPVRVLMMVDNAIDGDSRVQRAARSVAALGYDVTLLGRYPGRGSDRRPLGQATVRRVATPFTLEGSRTSSLHRLQTLASSISVEQRLDTVRSRFWRLVLGTACWRPLEPRLLDYETSFWPVVRELRPDVLHAHDYKMIGVAVRAAARLRAQGHDVRVVYDAHEFLAGVTGPTPRWQIAYEAYEADHIRDADGVVVVSHRLGELLVDRYGLREFPTVVMNCPEEASTDPTDGAGTDIRTVLGLPDEVPLLVYSGASAARRGLDTALDALAALPGAHLALVTARNAYVESLVARAGDLGVADRFHVLPYVPQDQVTSFLRTATVGLIPIHHMPNHEIALITKYFEYVHAGLPIITSDVETMAAQTRELGNGEVFRAADAEDLTRAVRAVLADLDTYRKRYAEHADVLEQWSFERQAIGLDALYERLLARPASTPLPLTARQPGEQFGSARSAPAIWATPTRWPRWIARALVFQGLRVATHDRFLRSGLGVAGWRRVLTTDRLPARVRARFVVPVCDRLAALGRLQVAADLLAESAAAQPAAATRARILSATALLSLRGGGLATADPAS